MLCVDNVNPACTDNDMSAFISGMSVKVVSCFEAKSRRRRGESADITDRKAFRVCVYENDLERLLNADRWPDSISISEWYFKSASSNTANVNDDKRTRVDSECLQHETQLKTSCNQNNDGMGFEAQSCAMDNDATVVVNYDGNNMDCVVGGTDGV